MCDCFEDIDARLSAHNTRLTPMFSLGGDTMELYPMITTEKINSRERKGPVRVTPVFCPFCGVRYDRPIPRRTEPKTTGSDQA